MFIKERKTLPAERLVFIDESGVTTGMTRKHGRALKKNRAYDNAPINHGKSVTIISSVRLDGSTVPFIISGAMNGDVFKSYISEQLLPTLGQGDIVVMDNLSSHKVDGVKKAIEAAGAQVRYIPPYSPDLNPIEEMWSKLKAYLRKVKARTADNLLTAITDGFKTITTENCIGWFTHAGYTQNGQSFVKLL
jgi:transposase